MLSKLTNNKFEESCVNFVLCQPTHSGTDQNAPLSKHDVCGGHGSKAASEEESNGTALMDENNCAPRETEPSLPLKKQISPVQHEEFYSDCSMANAVLDTDEHILAPSEKKPTHNTDKQPVNNAEHSLTKCQYCLTTFPYSLFKSHAQTCNESTVIECSNIVEENSLLQHHKQTCTKRKMYKCSKCEKYFRVQSKLLIHQQVHSNERPYPCEICSKPFKFRSGLSRHMRREHSTGGETQHEKLCGDMQGEQNSTLQKDISFQIGVDSYDDWVKKDGQGQCNESTCREEHFLRQTDFETSKTKLRLGARPFKRENVKLKNCCQPVAQTIVTESEDDGSIRRWPKTFETETNYSKPNTSFVCIRNVGNPKSYLELPQKRAEVPNRHLLDAKHSPNGRASGKGKVYECEYCSSVFEKPSKLLVHKRIHSEERLFTCEICQNTFKHKGSLTRHVKEQHYSQGRRASSVPVDGKQRRIREHPGSLEVSNFENFDDCLFGENESKDHTVVPGNYSSDEEQSNLSMVFDRKQESKMRLSYWGESNCRNAGDPKASLLRENGTFRYGRGKDLEQEQNNSSMIFRVRQESRGDSGLFSHDDVSLRNVGNTDKFLVSKSEIGFECEDCSHRNGLFSQNEFSIESHDNTNDDHTRERLYWWYKEDNFEVHENIKQTKHDLQCGEINLENIGKGVKVNASPREMPEEPKLYQCTICPRMFPRSSALRKHKKLHNDITSFSCKICGRYFKYKGSLTRHVKEQHYGQGRKSFSTVVDGQEENRLEIWSSLEAVCFEDAVHSPLGNGGSTRSSKERVSKVGVEDSMTVDDGTKEELDLQNGDRHSEDRRERCYSKEDTESCESLDREDQNYQCDKFEGKEEDKKIFCLTDKVNFQTVRRGKECLVKQTDAFKCKENNGSNPSLGETPNIQVMISDGKQGDEKEVACFGNVDHTEVCLEAENETCKRDENDRSYESLDKRRHSLSVVMDDRQEYDGAFALPDEDSLASESREKRSETFQCEEDNFAGNNLPKLTKRKVYECSECPQTFPIPSALRKHKVIHSDKMPFSCQTCGRYFKYKGSLRRHIKEQHYGLGRKSLSLVFGDMGGYTQINYSPLEENKNFLDNNESWKREDGSSKYLNERDFGEKQNNASMVVDEKNEGKPRNEDCSSAEKSSFDNCIVMRENEIRDFRENIQQNAETSNAGHNDRSVIFDGMQRDEMTLTDELEKDVFQNADSLGDTDIPSRIHRERREDEERVRVRDRDNKEESETWNHEENNFPEVPENFPHLGNGFESVERNLKIKTETFEFWKENFDVDEHDFEVNSRPFETPNKCYFSATQSDLMEKYERIKVYECPECQKAFAKSSHLRKHMQTHSDVMSFSCQICEHRFKYKDSLSRHIKEQHYGQGRKGLSIEMAEKLGREEGNKKLILLQMKDDFQNKGRNFVETTGEECIVKETFEPSIVNDERSRNFEVNYEIRSHNEQAIQKKGSVSRNGDILLELNGEEGGWNNIEDDKPKIGSDNLEKAPVEFSCTLCGRYCKYKSWLSRHYKEQHLGQGRKADKNSFEEGNTKRDYFDRVQNDDINKSNLENRFVDVKENGNEIESNFEQILQEDNVALTREDNSQSSYFGLLKVKKVHKCPDCSKTFWSFSELKEHTYKHTDIRSFVCTLCGKAFKFRSGLVRHNRKEHKKNGLTDLVGENVKYENPSESCVKVENNSSKGEGEKHVQSIVDEIDESHSFPEKVNSVLNVVDQVKNAVVMAKSICQKQHSQKKPGSYNCNKCDAVFKQLCDFLAHQRIHK